MTQTSTPVLPAADSLFERFAPLGDSEGYSLEACEAIAGRVARIRAWKAEKDAVLLAHNYQRPEIFEVADFIGDSLDLSRRAADVDAERIVFCGVHFMAESAKILNPAKKVLLPDLRAGCSLADSVTAAALAERVASLRAIYPDLGVVSYVNTTADVKALSDACCTSANAVAVVEGLARDPILFVPDQNLAAWVQSKTTKRILSWDGNCYVHHQITPESILAIRRQLPDLQVIAHPECRTDVLALADAVLSTNGMVKFAQESDATHFLVVTECGLSDRLLLEVPGKRFFKACKLCRFMKMITLEAVEDALLHDRHEIVLPEPVRAGAERALRKMFELTA